MSTEWAFYLLFFNDDELKDALNITIGHELTHKENEFHTFWLLSKKKMFVKWVNELHADFGAAQKMANSERQKLLNSMEYKKARKDEDKSTPNHPSCKQRIYYAEHYDFGEELIRQIAKDTDCNNQKIIDEVCKHYQEIKLNPPPKKI